MSSNIKGLTLEISGETTLLTKALGDVNKHSKNLKSELRDVERLLKLDPKNTELLAQKQKILSESIENTSSKLLTLKDAQRQAQEQFEKGEIAEEQYRAIQREVVRTEAELRSLESSLGDINNKWEDVGNKISDIGNKTSELGNKLTPLSTAAAGVATGMAAMAVKVGQSADDINTLSKQTGLATDTIQKFKYASELIDVPLETMTGSLSKLTKNMGDAKNGSEKMKNAFKTLNVDIEDGNGNLRDNEEVFYDLMNALGGVANETERDALAMEIFGKSAQDLNPLILGGADALKELGKEAEDAGLILSQDALNAANEFNDEIDSMKANAAGTFAVVGMEILTVLKPALETVTDAIKNILEWFASLDASTLTWILSIAGLIAMIAPLLIVVGKMATGFGAIVKIVGTVSSSLSGIGTAITFLTGPIGIIILSVVALIAIFTTLWKTNEEFRENIINLWEQIKEIGVAFFEFFMEKLLGFYELIKEWWNEHSEKILESFRLFWDFISEIINIALEILTGIFDIFIGLFTGDWERMGEGIKKVWSGMWEGIKLILSGAWTLISGAFGILKENITGWFDGIVSSGYSWGKNLISGFIDGIKSMVSAVSDAVSGVVSGVADFIGFNSPSKKGEGRNIVKWGRNMISGFIDGMEDAIPDLELSAKSIAPVVKNEIVNTTKIDYGKIPKGDTTIYVNNPQPRPSELARQIKKSQQDLGFAF